MLAVKEINFAKQFMYILEITCTKSKGEYDTNIGWQAYSVWSLSTKLVIWSTSYKIEEEEDQIGERHFCYHGSGDFSLSASSIFSVGQFDVDWL